MPPYPAKPPIPGELPPSAHWAVPGQGYPPPYGGGQQAPGADGMAIGSFVTGLLGLWPVGLALGIVALVRKRPNRRRGKGLAIAGLVLAGVWALGSVALVGTAFVRHASTTTAAGPRTASGVRLRTLKPGDCYDQSGPVNLLRVKQVPCTEPHDAQLLKVSDELAGGNFPGETTSESTAANVCATAEFALMPDADSVLPDNVVVTFNYPSEQSWWAGEQGIYCFMQDVQKKKLTAPLAAEPIVYDADQTAYLKLDRPEQVSRHVYGYLADPHWADGQPYAVEVAADLRTEAAKLVAAKWPGAVGPHARALAAADLKEAKLWDAVVAANDDADWKAALARITASYQGGYGQAIVDMRASLQLP
ncbi:DUF4190 domain-containing protein [Streptacidiphilus cavernicola]|uniref:DUF4190 domain-containing protein n=1 Tax=Streptacidiphilus cavernicola TaxID=3342716 RepID=A0ABV6VNM6_9ACTN